MAGVDNVDPEQLIRRHQAGVWRYLRLLGCDAAEADDLMQETFLQVLRRGVEDRGPAAVARYLRQVARHLLMDGRRARRRAGIVAWADAVDELWTVDGDERDSVIWLDRLRHCVAGLTPRSRRAIELAYQGGLGRAAIAGELGMKENGVKTLMQRARAALRECLERAAPNAASELQGSER